VKGHVWTTKVAKPPERRERLSRHTTCCSRWRGLRSPRFRAFRSFRGFRGPEGTQRWAGLALFVALLVWLTAPLAGVAYADAGPAPTAAPGGQVSIRDVGFDPHLGAKVPLDLAFVDESGQAVHLRDYVTDRPVLLTLNYFDCQNLCPLELNSLVDTMNKLPFKLGAEYRAVSVSFNPANTPADATEMKGQLLHRYVQTQGAPDPAAGWHFLTGSDQAIQLLTQAVGFRYAYDAQVKDYAHPIGAILLTPDGHIARYLYGMDFPPKDLRLALVEASQSKISTPIDTILLLCYHYNPTAGRYSAVAMNAVRVGGAATVLVLGLFIGGMWRREVMGRRRPPPGAAS
jgi:protein SCO1